MIPLKIYKTRDINNSRLEISLLRRGVTISMCGKTIEKYLITAEEKIRILSIIA